MTELEIYETCAQVAYKDWTLRVVVAPDRFIQWVFTAPDNATGEPSVQHCRKWRISPHMTPSELVRTIYRAVLDAEQHEASEAFTFRGVDIFNHHLSVDALLQLRATEPLEMRAQPV